MRDDAAGAVDFAVAMAPKLRRAGVTRFRCGDVEFDIGPEQDEPPAQSSPEAPEFKDATAVRMHPLDDPETYNLPRGSALPGYRRPPKKDD